MIIIDGMNLAAVDLNLLVAFEALLVERNVSRAAKRIGLAQPSMSSALARLRLLFADELFVRTPREMRPTPRALALAGPVCQALQQIRTSLKKPEIFDPAATERRFMIGGSDNADFSLAPAMAHVLKAAPKIAIEILSLEKDSAVAMLDDGVLDFAVGCFDAQPKRFASAALYRDRYVCVRDRRLQPQRNRLTLEDFARARHLHVALDTAGSIDETLAAHGYRREIAVSVPNFAGVPYALEGSDLVAVVGERIGRRFAELSWIAIDDLPMPQEPWVVSALWRRHSQDDEALAWLCARLVEICERL
jgi:DNA-binding transcriptional LysR family regulator